MDDKDIAELQHEVEFLKALRERYPANKKGPSQFGHTRKVSLTLTAGHWAELEAFQKIDNCSLSQVISEIMDVFLKLGADSKQTQIFTEVEFHQFDVKELQDDGSKAGHIARNQGAEGPGRYPSPHPGVSLSPL